MCCNIADTTSSPIFERKQSALRITALTLCVSIIIVFFLSAAFIFTNANHQHDHGSTNGSCAVCLHIAAAENLLKQLSTASIWALHIIASLFSILFLFKSTEFNVGSFTLVTLKIRMNN